MPGQAAWDKEHGVDADVIAFASVARGEALGRDDNPAQPIFVQCHGCGLFAGAGLDLDKCNDTATSRDEIDFAASHTGASSEDPPTAQAQPPGSNRLRLAPALFGGDPPVQRLSSSARA